MRKYLLIFFLPALVSCSRHTETVNATVPFTFTDALELMLRRSKTSEVPAKPQNNAVFFSNEIGDVIVFKNYPHNGCDEFSFHNSQNEQIILGRWELRSDSLILHNSRDLTFYDGDSISCHVIQSTDNAVPQSHIFAVRNDSIISELPDIDGISNVFFRIK